MNNSTSFIENPVGLNVSRSKFNPKPIVSTTFSAGELVPVLNYELVQPGDSISMKMSSVIRSTTPLAPVMDDAYLDVFFFFVRHKDVLNRESMSNVTGASAAAHSFSAWIGAQDSLINVPFPEKSALPAVTLYGNASGVGGLADHLGYPIHVLTDNHLSVTPWSFLSYYSIWNNYFRDPNTMTPVAFSVSSDAVSPTGYGIAFYNAGSNLDCLYSCRRHGYFGSCLPWPQRNSTSVTLPLGDTAPLIATSSDLYDIGQNALIKDSIMASGTASLGHYSNVKVDLSEATASTVNQLRYSFALQKYYEKLARGGNRLQELTKALFGVTPHDMIDDVPEFLGGKSIRLENHLVANTAGTTYSTESQQSIGSTGAFSLTGDSSHYFTKSFDTWGTLMCVITVRPRESFSQGLDRQAFKFDALDLYSPSFANIGEMPIYKKELFCSLGSSDDEVFGYQPAWTEYRMIPDKTTGLLRAGKNLSYWTYVNNFSSAPTLSGYLDGSTLYKNFDQTLQVSKSTAGLQFMAQFKFDITMVRAMPTDSIPGLIDHA